MKNVHVKLAQTPGFGAGVAIAEPEVDESSMSVRFPFADGNRRDGVGDLLEIGGIDTSRHRQNPVVLFDHGKAVQLPIALAEDPLTKQYTVILDPAAKVATVKAYFLKGTKNYDQAVFSEQVFDLMARRFIRAGSIGYQVMTARELPPDYEFGVPKGLHLIRTKMLEASAVVMPANQDTVMKMLALPRICGKAPCPYLVKSLTPYAGGKKAVVTSGYGKKDLWNVIHEAGSWWVVKAGGRDGIPYKTREEAQREADRLNATDMQTVDLFPPGTEGSLYEGSSLVRGTVLRHEGRDLIVQIHGGRKVRTSPRHFGKSLSPLRQKYRPTYRRKTRHGTAGIGFISVRDKDLETVTAEAGRLGLKLTSFGNGKVKLVGADSAIDQVAKQYGRFLGKTSRGPSPGKKKGKVMAKSVLGKKKGKALEEDDVMVEDAASDVSGEPGPADMEANLDSGMGEGMPPDADLNDDGVTTPEEVVKYGLQCLQKVRQDLEILLTDYDSMQAPLENEAVKAFLTKACEKIAELLDEGDSIEGEEYGDSDSDADLEVDDDVDDAEGEDDELGDADPEAAVAADSVRDDEEEVSEEDVLVGMETEKALRSRHAKSLRRRYVKKLCPCGKVGCDCGEKDLTQDEAGQIAGDVVQETQDTELDDREVKAMAEAGGFLGELSSTSDFGDEHRMKSYHYFKTLEGIGSLAEAREELNQTPTEDNVPPSDFTPGAGAKNMGTGGGRKMCKAAANWFGELSRTRDFGDRHRKMCGDMAKQMEPYYGGGAQQEQAAVDEQMVEGMGEIKLLKLTFDRQMAEAKQALGLIGELKLAAVR